MPNNFVVKTKKERPMSTDMRAVLDRMILGETVSYGTAMISSGRAYFDADGRSIRAVTIKGLIERGLLIKQYGYPNGTIKLTEKGKRT